MTTNGTDTSTASTTSDLDTRRDKLKAAKAAATTAKAAATRVDTQLRSNASGREKCEGDLTAARERVRILEKGVKLAKKERGKLREAGKKADKRAAKAQQRADAAERKYDRAVLAAMVGREKKNDLSAHKDKKPAAAAGTSSSARTPATSTSTSVAATGDTSGTPARPKDTPTEARSARSSATSGSRS